MTIIFQSASPSSTMARVPSTFTCIRQVLYCVADPDPGSGAFSTLGSWIGMGRKNSTMARVPSTFICIRQVLYSVADPDPGSGANFLTPGSWIRDEQSGGSYFREISNQFFGLKFPKLFDADPGWEKFGSGINIPDPQHWSCIMLFPLKY
jgi:hypothetical protein